MSKIVVVTGGIRGIGASIAKTLKNEGYKVAATYQKNQSAAEEFFFSTGIDVFQWNVASYEECEIGVKKVEDKFGGSVEILVNNAGITKDAMFHKMSPQQWKDVIDTNLTSVFNMCRVVIEKMRDNGFGRIINISSINAQKGQVGQTNYSAAKSGIIGFSKSLAQESARKGITVNVIAPGYIETDMTGVIAPEIIEKITSQIPVGRFGSPDEIAKAVLFLASNDASFITGATISVNGGQYCL